MDHALIDSAARLLLHAKHAISLTGAGISTESGVPDFRSPGGLWERYDPSIFFIERFMAQPEQVWSVMIHMYAFNGSTLWDVIPNRGHTALAWLEQNGFLKSIITQNVDNLHQKAGSEEVIEFHGNLLFSHCMQCQRRYEQQETQAAIANGLPPRCSCQGVLKPDAVFFGEPIPEEALKRAIFEAEVCDVMLVIGTSAQVDPAALLPRIAKQGCAALNSLFATSSPKKPARIIEINNEATPLTGNISDIFIKGSAGEVLESLVQRIQELRQAGEESHAF